MLPNHLFGIGLFTNMSLEFEFLSPETPGIKGVYPMILHSYGENRKYIHK